MIKINIFNKNLIFNFLLILFSLIIIEISLHLIYRIQNKSFLFERVTPPIFAEDSWCCYKNKPKLNYIQSNPEFISIIKTDEYGIRIGDRTFQIDDKKKNILILGPSISFGHGVNYEDSYSFKLQEYFKNYNFKNGSVPGHPLELNICWFFNNIADYKPDIIIQNIYDVHMLNISNLNNLKEFCNSYCKKINIEVTDSGLLKYKGQFFFNLKGALKKSSIIFYSWYLYEQNIFKKRKDVNYINKNIGKQFYGNQKINKNKIITEYKKYIKVFQKINPDIKIYFVHIPVSFSVSNRYAHRFNIEYEDANEHRKKYKFFTGVMRENFDSIDTHKNLKEKDLLEQTYYNIDVHLTKFGNQVVFETLREYFEKKIN